ncbi:thiamine phosphate synthase [Sphingomonas sp. Leaf17]|uniref:thiamine phosphate synthase n=1 Tax=Sphingomonas sp. Leaf17 TaxID=1735683 RepID=UPI0009E937C4|nr:thiamine phosphate synthase [Sphingomonas sp. Leaf17]
MTDERMGDALWPALRALPPGSGVVFRHYATPSFARRALFVRVRRIARARRLVLVAARSVGLGRCDGVHGHGRERGPGIRTWPAHRRAEALAGVRAGADALFVSPVFATRSHPGAAALRLGQAVRIGRGLGRPVIALGGMTAMRFRRIRRYGFDGWAAIDGVTPQTGRTRTTS